MISLVLYAAYVLKRGIKRVFICLKKISLCNLFALYTKGRTLQHRGSGVHGDFCETLPQQMSFLVALSPFCSLSADFASF